MKDSMNTYSLDLSLLFPDDSKACFRLGKCTANDLDIDFIAKNLSSNGAEQKVIANILLDMPCDMKVVGYRRKVYSDLREHYDVCERMYDIFDSMRFYVRDRNNRIDEGSTIYDLLTRLKSLESYIRSIYMLKEVVDGVEFRSEGMKRFAEMVTRIYNNSGFEELTKDIGIISDEISNVKSLTIGVNLNNDFYPVETGIISLNSFWFTEQSALKNFIKYQRKDRINDKELMPFSIETHGDSLNKSVKKFRFLIAQKDGLAASVADYTASDSPLMNNLNKIIERMLPSMTDKLKKTLNKYVDISGKALGELADEVLFYLRFIELERKLTADGLPCCMGESSEDDTRFSGFYNVKLAICRLIGTVSDEIVCNDIEFTNDKTVQLLTGPNRGGKTILTQGIGLAFLLYQSGVFVPASSAAVRLCTGIFTHFPVEEEHTVSLGRLGEEASRFCEISKNADSGSLVLLNESFATTSHTESLYIAEDAIKYLCCLGARTVFNTHMHELAEKADSYGKTENAVCKAVSLVMESDNGKRSYKVSYKKPDGKSYAHEIAYRFGITFEQLMGNLDLKENSHVTANNDI
ncbi:MutS-related protein [Ruminococcus sp. XPD3002]|uniref:MutS-related protein n=1 Tax=Ruminococcus sp. XPD3002 TaxID=1452269 RepID=UPI00091910A4|nr:MutS domain V [Ruminococcus flavefaciens]